MEQRRKDIEALTRTHGYTEEEAEVAYHLMVARDRLAALHRRRFEEERPGPLVGQRAGISWQAYVDPHFRALLAVLDGWVLDRDYPDRFRRPHSGADEEGSG
jgi:hypothetical protein